MTGYCLRCGGPFIKARNQKYDADACRRAAQRERRGQGKVCAVNDCSNRPAARGWCMKHYKRWRISGDPLKLTNKPGWTIDKSTGYRRRLIGGRLVYEHRYVMEIHLGRSLDRREQVHHLDGDRTNNAIENLEVMMRGDHQRFHNLQDSAVRRMSATSTQKRRT